MSGTRTCRSRTNETAQKSAIGKETIEQPEVPQKKEDEDNEILAVHLLLVQVRKAR
jgi:hypothetical protein